jgi:hypothetical protein
MPQKRWRFIGPLPSKRRWTGTRQITVNTRVTTTSSGAFGVGQGLANRINLPSKANVQALNTVVIFNGSNILTMAGSMSLYDNDSSLNKPKNLITYQMFSVDFQQLPNNAIDIIRVPLGTPALVPSGLYWVVLILDTLSTTAGAARQNGSAAGSYIATQGGLSNPPPSPWPGGPGTANVYLDLFAEYYPAVGAGSLVFSSHYSNQLRQRLKMYG